MRTHVCSTYIIYIYTTEYDLHVTSHVYYIYIQQNMSTYFILLHQFEDMLLLSLGTFDGAK
jgi:hypothetical protein